MPRQAAQTAIPTGLPVPAATQMVRHAAAFSRVTPALYRQSEKHEPNPPARSCTRGQAQAQAFEAPTRRAFDFSFNVRDFRVRRSEAPLTDECSTLRGLLRVTDRIFAWVSIEPPSSATERTANPKSRRYRAMGTSKSFYC